MHQKRPLDFPDARAGPDGKPRGDVVARAGELALGERRALALHLGEDVPPALGRGHGAFPQAAAVYVRLAHVAEFVRDVSAKLDEAAPHLAFARLALEVVHMPAHERHDLAPERVGAAQAAERRVRQFRAGKLVSVHTAALGEGNGLAHVVQQHREADRKRRGRDRRCAQAVAEHVVGVVLRLLRDARAGRELGQHGFIRAAGLKRLEAVQKAFPPRAVARVREQELRQFLPDPLGGNIQQAPGVRARGVHRRGVDGKAELRREARHAKDTQGVVPHDEAGVGRCRADTFPLKVGHTARRVYDAAFEYVEVDCVDCEVAAEGVLLERVGVGDPFRPVRAAAAVGFAPKARVLELLARRAAARDEVERAEGRALGEAAEALFFAQSFDPVRAHGGADVRVAHGQAEQRVSHHAAHGVERMARFAKGTGEAHQVLAQRKAFHSPIISSLRENVNRADAQSTAKRVFYALSSYNNKQKLVKRVFSW